MKFLIALSDGNYYAGTSDHMPIFTADREVAAIFTHPGNAKNRARALGANAAMNGDDRTFEVEEVEPAPADAG